MKLGDRVNDLERLVSELEGSFGFLTGQVKGVHRSLLEFQGETRERFDGADARLDRVETRVETGFREVNAKLDAMPEIIASSVADALRS